MWNLNTIWYSSAYINTLFYNNYMYIYIYIYLCIQPFGFSNLAPSEFQPRMGKTDIPRIVYMSKEDLSVLCFCVVSGVWFDFGGHQLLWFQLGWCLLSLVVFIQAAGAKLGAVRYSKSCRLSVRGQDITQKNLGPPIEFVGGETASKRLQTLFVFWFFVVPKLLQLRMAIVPDLNIPQALQWKHRIRIKELVHFAGPKQNFLRLHNGKWSGGCNR